MNNVNLLQFIKENQQSLHLLLDLIPIPAFIKDVQGIYLTCNTAFEDFFGFSRQQIQGKTVYDLWIKSEADKFYTHDKALFSNPGKQIYKTAITSVSDIIYFVQFHKATFLDSNDNVAGLLGVMFDLTKQKSMEDKLKKLAATDALTKLPNRRQLKNDFNLESKRANRFDRKMSLFYIDINNFKSINDDLGHAVGDKLLWKLSEKLSNSLRENEKIYRVGGDEFCILVTEFSNKAQLEALAQRVINTISSITDFGGMQIEIGCSVGIAIFPENGKNLPDLTSAADRAMYLIKTSHRNGFCFVN